MAISLSKGANISLSKTSPGLKRISIGLGWDVRATDGAAFDLDLMVFMVGVNDKVRSDADFIFFNQTRSGDGSLVHSGDNRTGAGDGDDESIKADLNHIPSDVAKLIICSTIDEAESRRQNFGMVRSALIRIVDDQTSTEIARYDLSEDASVETAMIFGEVYRNGGEWKFRAVGQGFQGGLAPLARNFGVNI